MARNVNRSSVSSDGSLAAIAESCSQDRALPLRSLSRYIPAKTKLETRMPEEAIMLLTWILSQ